MFVGTIHAFCLDLLKTEVPKYLKFEVLNEVQQSLLTDRNSKKSGLTECRDLAGSQLRRFTDTALYLEALSILREAETEGHVLAGCSVVQGLNAYRDLLDSKSYFDYSAILDAASTVLQNDEGLRKRIAERVRYVIVDEYQDVNHVQEAIVSALYQLGAKVCVVGDDDQTVYQWRGSDVRDILTFTDRYPDVQRIVLDTNFRSSEGVVEIARRFIEQNQWRLKKVMKAAKTQDYELGDITALSFSSAEEEAQYIAQTVLSLEGIAFKEDNSERGLSLSDMAVLLRSVKRNGQPIMDAFDKAGIPYVVIGMNNLFKTAEAEAARKLFYFIADQEGIDKLKLETAWHEAKLGINRAKLQVAIANVSRAKLSLQEPEQKQWGLYNIQRVFLNFLEDCELREDNVPDDGGEIVLYNLGKFSQLISDFETINFHSKPADKYRSFADFLKHRAEDAYPEGWQDSQYDNLDAVRIMTIHQAKGMQWPVVFVPAVIRNRFPSRNWGGRDVWSLLPKHGIKGQERYEGTIEDERRLFYVALTRSQKFLHVTWAPTGSRTFSKPSEFWENMLGSIRVMRRPPDYAKRKRMEPQPRKGVINVSFSFSELKYYFQCPYEFKLRILYGFNAPIHEAMGYGKSLHDALAEMHARVARGDAVKPEDVPDLLSTHFHTPYAYPALKQKLEIAANKVLDDYIKDNKADFDNIEFFEKQVEITLGDGITVNGRIDLVRRKDSDETTVVDLKSRGRAQAEEITEAQLHVYALGYKELTGRRPDYVEVYELSDRKRVSRAVDDDFILNVQVKVRSAANALQENDLPPAPTHNKCSVCDYPGMCSAAQRI